METIFVDLPPDQVLIRELSPNQVLIEFLNPYKPTVVNVYMRHDPKVRYTNVYCHEVPPIVTHPMYFDDVITANNGFLPTTYNPYVEQMHYVEEETAPVQDCKVVETTENQPKKVERRKSKKRKGHNVKNKESKKFENAQEANPELTPPAPTSCSNASNNVQDEKETSESDEPLTNTSDEENRNDSIVGSTDEAYGSEESLNYYSLIIRNVALDNPYNRAPNELNRHCSQRIKDEIPLLKGVSARCIVMECFGNGRYYGTIKLDVSKEEIRDSIASLEYVTIGGRRCPVQKNASRINAFRCFRCQAYRSHDTRSCKAPREYCLKCSESHRFKECPVRDHSFFRCINCLRAGYTKFNHMAGTFYCPIELKQRKLAAKAAKRNQDIKEQEQAVNSEEITIQDPKPEVAPESMNKPFSRKGSRSAEKTLTKKFTNFFV